MLCFCLMQSWQVWDSIQSVVIRLKMLELMTCSQLLNGFTLTLWVGIVIKLLWLWNCTVFLYIQGSHVFCVADNCASCVSESARTVDYFVL